MKRGHKVRDTSSRIVEVGEISEGGLGVQMGAGKRRKASGCIHMEVRQGREEVPTSAGKLLRDARFAVAVLDPPD